jgi:predicted flap endonuclease-1-like 5' DNA nuclease
MEVGLFVLGILVGVGLTWYLLERYRHEEAEQREANFNARLAALQAELRESDFALAETKERLIGLQMEFRATEARAAPLEAELAQAKRAAEQATELEMRQRRLVAELQERLAGDTPESPAVTPAATPVADAPIATAPIADSRPDDLTAIRGVGKVIERKLHQMGITSFGQIAALTPEEVRRVNDAIDFPGRVERERWIDQARELARA